MHEDKWLKQYNLKIPSLKIHSQLKLSQAHTWCFSGFVWFGFFWFIFLPPPDAAMGNTVLYSRTLHSSQSVCLHAKSSLKSEKEKAIVLLQSDKLT